MGSGEGEEANAHPLSARSPTSSKRASAPPSVNLVAGYSVRVQGTGWSSKSVIVPPSVNLGPVPHTMLSASEIYQRSVCGHHVRPLA